MKKTIRLASSLALTSAVAGCLGAPSVPVSQLATSQVTTPLATAQSGVNAGPGFRTAADEAQGTVAIQINWPDRKGQAIPWSANSAIIYLYDSNGVLLNNGRQVVGRPAANPSQPLIAGSLASQTYFPQGVLLAERQLRGLFASSIPVS